MDKALKTNAHVALEITAWHGGAEVNNCPLCDVSYGSESDSVVFAASSMVLVVEFSLATVVEIEEDVMQAFLSDTVLTFSHHNWYQVQLVRVSAVDDLLEEEIHNTTLVHASVSLDDDYSATFRVRERRDGFYLRQ